MITPKNSMRLTIKPKAEVANRNAAFASAVCYRVMIEIDLRIRPLSARIASRMSMKSGT